MTKKQAGRILRLIPEGVPRFIRIYDNGGPDKPDGTCDRYTVVFTGPYRHKTGGAYWYIGMSGAPFHPQGIGQHGESTRQIDRPTYGHLGRKIKWAALPEDCKCAVLMTYTDLWDVPMPAGAPRPSITVKAG